MVVNAVVRVLCGNDRIGGAERREVSVNKKTVVGGDHVSTGAVPLLSRCCGGR